MLNEQEIEANLEHENVVSENVLGVRQNNLVFSLIPGKVSFEIK